MSLAGKTFILNSSITVSTNFGAAKNGGDNTLFTCNNVSYNAFSATKLSSTTYAYYMNLSWSNIKTYQNGWQDEAYRTIKFVADPTDYSTGFTELSQFEEWLGANATEVYDDNAETFTATDGKSYHFRDDRLPYVDGDDNGKVLMVSGGEWIADEQATFTGATGVTGGSDGLVPAPAAADDMKFLRGDGTWANGGRPMVILSYGNSTWSDFTTAYNNNVIVYCRASSGSNPATGSQTRMAFMAYVNDATSPTEVEFQYYRSVSSHSDSQQGDQVYVYKLNSSGTWSVTVRSAFTKIVAGTNLTSSYSSGVLTISGNYSVASTASDGLMSSADKTLLGTLNNQITINALTSSQKLTTVALDNTSVPANSVRWFNVRNADTSDLPLYAQTSVARVTKRINGTCFIELFNDGGNYWTNSYDGSNWSGWYSVKDQIANRIQYDTHTGTTNSNGLIYVTPPTGKAILNAYTNTGTTALIQFGAAGFRAYNLANGAFEILRNTEITITYYYA